MSVTAAVGSPTACDLRLVVYPLRGEVWSGPMIAVLAAMPRNPGGGRATRRATEGPASNPHAFMCDGHSLLCDGFHPVAHDSHGGSRSLCDGTRV